MATDFATKKERSPFQSANSHHPRPPSTPYLTGKILTLASSSERREGLTDHREQKSLPPPISPSDKIAQAMKNDLDELIGYIDNLAFEKKNGRTGETTAKSPSTIKQLFPGEENSYNIIHDKHGTKQNNVFQDRTNRFMTNTREVHLLRRLADPEVSTLKSQLELTARTPSKNRRSSIDDRKASIEKEPKMLEPVGNPPRREEPAGSPPSQEASFYFHDESMSLNLSHSQDTDESNKTDSHLNIHHSLMRQDNDGPERPNRLTPSLKTNGEMLSPDRSKKISFLPISKDPTPSKNIKSSLINGQNSFATPTGQTTKIFDSIPEDETELHSTNAFRLQKFGNRGGTPYPSNHDHTLDRIEQDNIDRKGNEWWRIRSKPLDNSIQTVNQLRFYSKDSSSANENNDGLSLNSEDNVKSSSRGTQNVSEMEALRHVKTGDTIVETPEPHQCKKSDLVLTSPESAKKLLRKAIEALQDARKERDEARQWADNVKKSVNEWVEDQRRLIRTESGSISDSNPVSAAFVEQQHQAIESLIDGLRSDIKTSKSHTETEIRTMMVKQDEQIQELSRQLMDFKEQLSRLMKEDIWKKKVDKYDPDRNSNNIEKLSRFNNVDAPGFAHKTPCNEATGLARCASRSETSHASSRGSHRTRQSTPNGGHLINYGNGVTKELHPDGTSVTRFRNGDIETRFGPNVTNSSSPSASCMVAYYHSKEEVLQITQRDGSTLYEYANGQVERHCADGVKIVLFPDGTKTVV